MIRLNLPSVGGMTQLLERASELTAIETFVRRGGVMLIRMPVVPPADLEPLFDIGGEGFAEPE